METRVKEPFLNKKRGEEMLTCMFNDMEGTPSDVSISELGGCDSATLTHQSVRLMETLLRSVLTKDGNDSASRVRVVFEGTGKRWEVACGDTDADADADSKETPHPTSTYQKRVRQAVTLLHLASAGIENASRDVEHAKKNTNATAAQLCSLYECLLETTQRAAVVLCNACCLWQALRRQRHLASMLQLQVPSEEAGDAAMLLLLDASDARMTAHERMLVANAFADPSCAAKSARFRDAVTKHTALGKGIADELQRVGILF